VTNRTDNRDRKRQEVIKCTDQELIMDLNISRMTAPPRRERAGPTPTTTTVVTTTTVTTTTTTPAVVPSTRRYRKQIQKVN
jgi:hypothetical protein